MYDYVPSPKTQPDPKPRAYGALIDRIPAAGGLGERDDAGGIDGE